MNEITKIVSTEVALAALGQLGNIVKRKFSELIEGVANEVGITVDEILESKSGQEAVRIAVDFMKTNNGFPSEDVLIVLKAMLVKYWQLSSRDDLKAERSLDFAEIVAGLKRNELLLLITAYKDTKSKDYQYTNNVIDWTKRMEIKTGFNYPELVYIAREGLERKRLICATVQRGKTFNGSVGTDIRNNLTGLGYGIIDSVYSELREYLES